MTITANTGGMETDIKRAFGRVDGSGAGRKAGQQFGQNFSSSAAGSVDVGGLQAKMAGAGALGAKALGGALTVGVAAAGAAVTATLGAALSKGWDRLVSIDDAKFKLKALGNSAADVQDIMDSALASVKGTAYGFGEAANIAASAVAAGVKPGEELTKYLTMTADAAAVANTSLGDMGRILNQARTSGNVYAEDLQQLSERGLPIYQWLGEEAGVAAGQVKKLASEGRVSSQMLEAAIQKNIGGAAKTMGESFSGSVKNAQAALGRLGEALLAPVFQAAPAGIGGITTALDGLTAWIKNNQGTIITFWETVGVAAISAVQDVTNAVGNITILFGNLVGGIGNVQGAMLKIQAIAADFRGDGEEADRLRAESEAAFGWGESLKEAGNKILGANEAMERGKESLRSWGDAARSNAEVLGRLGDDASKATGRIRDAFKEIPRDVPISVSAPGGEEVYQLMRDLGVEVTTNNAKEIVVEAPLAPEVVALLESLNIKVRTDNDKLILVRQDGAEEAGDQIDAVADKDYTAIIKVLTDTSNAQVTGTNIGGLLGVTPRAEGAIVPGVDAFANGGLKRIEKPDQADIYAGRGAGTIFAEEETGGEAYIPLAPEKRGRSMEILSEVARIFGVSLGGGSGGGTETVSVEPSAPAGDLVAALSRAVTDPIVSALGQIRDAIASSRSSSYSSSSPVTFTGSLAGFDQALLAQVPKGGRYDASGNLEQGLADCSSAIEDLVNLMDGMPTAGREMSTGNAAEWLASRGFLPTDSPVPGAFNVGFNSHHMEATLPGGTNVNFGSDASVASGGVAGAVGAWGDPSFTQHYYRAVSALDANTEAWSALTSTTDDLNAALDDRAAAETSAAETITTQTDQATEKNNNSDMSSLGSSLMGGVLETFGLDGGLFSNPFEWANVKSLTALANWGGGLLQGALTPSGPVADAGGGSLGIPGVPNVADFLKPLPAGAMEPQKQPDAPHQGGGQPPGPAVVVNGNIGMDPRQFTQRVDAAQNQAYRRNLSSVRP